MPHQQVHGVQIYGRSQDDVATLTQDGAKQRLDVSSLPVGALIPADYDAILLTPASQPTTIEYFVGGTTGTVVATLTIVYDGTDIQSITRS